MATVPLVGEERYMLEEVNWEAYEALLNSWAHRRIRVTYDNGRLEIMSPLLPHESYSALMGQFIEAFTDEMNIARKSGASTTFRKKSKKRGLEADQSYWIKHERVMRGKKDFDPDTDPPPDLAIEVDITSSSLDRMSIYATLGVPEIWRYDGALFTIHLLQPNGQYAVSDTSAALPALTPEVVTRFLDMSDEVDETTLMRSFRAWVREQVVPPPPAPPKKARRPRKK